VNYNLDGFRFTYSGRCQWSKRGVFPEKFCKSRTAIESRKAIKRHAAIERNTAIERPSVNFAASPRTFANSPGVPTVVLVDLQQGYPAKPRLPAISATDRALKNCRRAARVIPADDIHHAVSKISGL
jgi:hypothetical protein